MKARIRPIIPRNEVQGRESTLVSAAAMKARAASGSCGG